MSLPAATGQGGHHEFLLDVQQRLLREYAELLKKPPASRRGQDPGEDNLVPNRRFLEAARRRPARRRDPPVYRFDGPHLQRLHSRHRPRQPGMARIFVLMLLLHVVILAGIVIGDVLDWRLTWKAAGVAFLIWLVIRLLAALSRRIRQRRRTTSRGGARNCDRDLFL